MQNVAFLVVAVSWYLSTVKRIGLPKYGWNYVHPRRATPLVLRVAGGGGELTIFYLLLTRYSLLTKEGRRREEKGALIDALN